MSRKKLPFKKIDAFATEHSDGNPAGLITLQKEEDLSPEEMLRIALELKTYVSEVGYIWPLDKNRYRLKYYSPEREVNFCGHATIALMYDLFTSHNELINKERIDIVINQGIIQVENRIKKENAVFIMAPPPREGHPLLKKEEIARNLNIHMDNIDKNLPVELIDAGLKTLLVPINNLDALLEISPELERLKEFCEYNGIDIVEVFTPETCNKKNHYRARVFPATFGYLEDPATGSGNSAFGYYLMNNGLWTHSTMVIEQNASRERYNIIKLQKKQDDLGNDRIIFGGGAITRIEGFYHL